jgi:peptidyl-prolyl cis-trans isomerase SurA
VIKRFAIILPAALLAASLFGLSAPNTHAQEGEAVVVDEVIAQVNDGVITLSVLKREMKSEIDGMVQDGKSKDEAATAVEAKKAELINTLINDELLLQKGKELDLAQEVEADVNSRLLAVAKEQGITKLEDLCTVMKQQGVDCDEVRASLRREVMKVAVLNREVDGKLFYGWSDKELQDYFKLHPEKFMKAESVNISEIWLEFAGKSEADVKVKAAQIIAQARGGADFATLAKTYSDRVRNGVRTAPTDGGLVGTLEVPTIKPEIAAAIKPVKAGDVTEPIISTEGIQIIRVNERTAGSSTPVFSDNAVRESLTMEKIPDARKEYLAKLRDDAYVKVAEGYRGMVGPLVGEVNVPKSVSSTTDGGSDATASSGKKSDKKDKKDKKKDDNHKKDGKQ